ncbi:MAG: DUF4129 domain-containing protein [Ilumatobacteraceae bacterium]
MAVVVAAGLMLLVLASGTGTVRNFHSGVTDHASQWLRSLAGGLAGIAVGTVALIVVRRVGRSDITGQPNLKPPNLKPPNLKPPASLPLSRRVVALTLATCAAIGVTVGIAATHIGPPAPPTIPADAAPPLVTAPPADAAIPQPSSASFPTWLNIVLILIALVIIGFGVYEIGRSVRLPRFRIGNIRRRQTATAAMSDNADELDVESAADSFDESATMLGDDQDPRRAIIAAYAHLLDRLAEAGCPRFRFEAPEEHLRRSLTSLGLMAPTAGTGDHGSPGSEAMEVIIDRFLIARFSHNPVTEADRDQVREALRRAGSRLRELADKAQVPVPATAGTVTWDQSDRSDR